MNERNPVRYDQGMFRGDAEKTDEGYLKTDAIVTRTGVFLYVNADGTIRKELRHPDDVFSQTSLRTLQMIPMTLNHPSRMVNADNAKNLSVGHVGERVYPDGMFVGASLLIVDAEAIRQIEEENRRELSLGYEIVLVAEEGTYKGENYDFRQTDIRYNHLALVDRARAGPLARIPDSFDHADCIEIRNDELDKISTKQNKEDSTMENMVKVSLDTGLSYDAAPEVASAFNKMKAELESAQTKLDGLIEHDLDGTKVLTSQAMVSALDASNGKCDTLEEKLKKSQGDDFDKAVNAAVKVRVSVMDIARSVLEKDDIEKMDAMSQTDLMKAVILSQTTEDSRKAVGVKLDEGSEDYLKARYDAVAEGVPARDSKIADARSYVNPKPASASDSSDVPDAAKARRDYMQGLRDASKPKSPKKEGN